MGRGGLHAWFHDQNASISYWRPPSRHRNSRFNVGYRRDSCKPYNRTPQSLRFRDFNSSSAAKLPLQVGFLHADSVRFANVSTSFEWYLDLSSWRASVHLWGSHTTYRHSQTGDRLLADSGWHCSYCFRTIPEYIIKMKGFSHSDRIGGRAELLEPKRIQETICRGKDIFDMLPEAYSVSCTTESYNFMPLNALYTFSISICFLRWALSRKWYTLDRNYQPDIPCQ